MDGGNSGARPVEPPGRAKISGPIPIRWLARWAAVAPYGECRTGHPERQPQNTPMKFSSSASKPRSAMIAAALFLAASLQGVAAEPKLVPLFNGKDLTNFKAEDSKAFWRAENGILIGENDAAKKGNYLWTQKDYGDFVIEFDVRWTTKTERGVDTGLEMRKPHIQLQLGVSGSLRVDMSGSFYTGGKPAYPEAGQAKEAKKLMKPEGQWNTFRIQAKGNTFTCWINGKKASEYTDPKFSGAAPLGFQIHPGVDMKCEYRNIKIAEL
jgi:hypothetical protein